MPKTTTAKLIQDVLALRFGENFFLDESLPGLDEIARIDIYLPGAAHGHGGWQPERPLAPRSAHR